jgi:hypothetical protein
MDMPTMERLQEEFGDEKTEEELRAIQQERAGEQGFVVFVSPDGEEMFWDFMGGFGTLKNVGQQAVKKGGVPIFKGFKDYSTKIVEQMKDRALVSRQWIEDLTKQSGLKKPDIQVIREVLEEYPVKGKIAVQEFADKVKTRIVPLKARDVKTSVNAGEGDIRRTLGSLGDTRLNYKLRGPTSDYGERVYESPIENAVRRHYNSDKYFGHTSWEDVGAYAGVDDYKVIEVATGDNVYWKIQAPGGQSSGVFSSPEEASEAIKRSFEGTPMTERYIIPSNTRRLIEIQSDYFQTGTLRRGSVFEDDILILRQTDDQDTEIMKMLMNKYQPEEILGRELTPADFKRIEELSDHPITSQNRTTAGYAAFMKEEVPEEFARLKNEIISRAEEIEKKLSPYENDWFKRMIREEVKKAAQDGKTKLQFPTGPTAMEIERLGSRNRGRFRIPDEATNEMSMRNLQINDIKVGKEIRDSHMGGDHVWVIIEDLGDGEFMAAPRQRVHYIFGDPAKDKALKAARNQGMDTLTPDKKYSYDRNYLETFDIGDKKDKEHTVYKFYDQQVAKFVKQLDPNAKVITDEQGVTWLEMDIKKSDAIDPVQVFGVGLLPFFLPDLEEE